MTFVNDDGSVTSNAAPRLLVSENTIFADLARQLAEARAEIERLTAERDRQYDENVHRIAEQAKAEAELATLKAAMVKPLEWNKGKANTPFGPYHCIEETNDEEPFWFVMFNGRTAQLGTFGDEASACAAAQSDYTARILSALNIQQEEQEVK